MKEKGPEIQLLLGKEAHPKQSGEHQEERVAQYRCAVESRFISEIWAPVRERLASISRVGFGAEREPLSVVLSHLPGSA